MADDAELRLKLTGLGVDVGPITDSTRSLYERMLRKRQNEQQASVLGSAAKKPKPSPSSSSPSSSSRVTKSKPISRSTRFSRKRSRISRNQTGASIIPGVPAPASKEGEGLVSKAKSGLQSKKAGDSSLLQDRSFSEGTPPPRIYPTLPPLLSFSHQDPHSIQPPRSPPLSNTPFPPLFQPKVNPPNPPQKPSVNKRYPPPSAPKLQIPPNPPSAPSFQHRANTPSSSSSLRSNQRVSPPSPPLPRARRQSNSSSFHNPPSPISSSSSTNSTDSGMVTTITGWLGSRVKGILNRIQEAASPSPRRPLSSKPASPSSPSSSGPIPSAPFSSGPVPSTPPPPPKSPRVDSISIDELDFAGEPGSSNPGPVYLQLASPRLAARDPAIAAPNPQFPAVSPSRPHRSPIPPRGRGSIRYDWELMPEDVQICKKTDGELWLLGKGGCGQVYRGLKDGIDDVAIKVIRLQPSSEPHMVVAQFKQEIDTISRLRHRHVLQFYGACIQPSCLFMVTELMDTDLFSALREQGMKYTWGGEHGREVLLGIAAGLNHLHSRRPPIVHRDIKSPNILVIGGLAKIADVGIANTMATTDMTAQRGFTIAWAAPEVILRKRANEKIDIWSFGIILWEVISGKVPRSGQLVMPYNAPPNLISLYSRCTSDNPSNRPSAPDIIHCLKHPQ